MQFDPAGMDPQDVYKIMAALIVPRPIGFTSTLGPDGVHNLAPFSFFMMITSSPPHVALSIGAKDGQEKDTLRNIRAEGEYVINTVNRGIGQQMARTAVDFEPDISEFQVSGLTAVPSDVVKPPRVLEAPASFECELRNILPVGGPPYGAHLVLGEIVRIHVQDDLLLENNRIDMLKLDALGRLTGDSYCATTEQFELKRS
jgi:flavin reductase (DIM6/NTAB) family NADH-FMN oxidoreductase RutF